MPLEIVRIVEVLGHAVAAKGDGAVPGDGVPEEARAGVGGLVARQRGDALETDDLRDLGVGVFAGELILVLDERVEDGLVVEALRRLQVAPVAGDGVDVRQHLVHAAMLLAEHPLHLVVAEA